MEKFARIALKNHEKLKVWAAEKNTSIKDLIGHMIHYFEETGINPVAPPKKDVALQMDKLRNQLVGFLRKQEKEQWEPMLAELQAANDLLGNFTKGLAREKSLQLMQYRIEDQINQRLTRYDFETHMRRFERDNGRSLQLFEDYLEERMQLSPFTSKEELNARYRKLFQRV